MYNITGVAQEVMLHNYATYFALGKMFKYTTNQSVIHGQSYKEQSAIDHFPSKELTAYLTDHPAIRAAIMV